MLIQCRILVYIEFRLGPSSFFEGDAEISGAVKSLSHLTAFEPQKGRAGFILDAWRLASESPGYNFGFWSAFLEMDWIQFKVGGPGLLTAARFANKLCFIRDALCSRPLANGNQKCFEMI